MKKSNAEKYNMMLAVYLVVTGAQLIWQNLQSFVDAFGRFTQKISDIEVADEVATRNIKGYAITKRQKRQTMTDLAMKIKGAVQSFADLNSDPVLFKRVNFTVTKLMHSKSANSLAYAKVIRDAGNDNVNNLAPYGVTAQTITDFDAVIQDFENWISAPLQARVDRETANRNVNQYIKDSSHILENQMDKLMDNFKASAPNFYSSYFISRRIPDIATHFTKFKLGITYQNNDQPVYGAAVHIESPTTGKVYNFISDLSGIAEERVIHGIYNITITKLGHPPVTLTDVEVKLGQQKNLDIELA